MSKKAIVLLSGGQDSTTSLYWAIKKFGGGNVIAIGFDYGQKHVKELVQAKYIAEELAKVPYIIFPCVGLLGGSSLTNHQVDHNEQHTMNAELPASFTAGRNALFLTVAAAYGHKWGITDIVTGVCQTDYSGYPDCRREFINSIEASLSLGIYGNGIRDYGDDTPNAEPFIQIHTPLMYLTKAATFKLAKELGCLDVIIEHTMTDYNGNTTKNEWGMGVDNNPATSLRVKGYYEAKEKGWI
jgi:7-cyano-7-deazaguanine synthase